MSGERNSLDKGIEVFKKGSSLIEITHIPINYSTFFLTTIEFNNVQDSHVGQTIANFKKQYEIVWNKWVNSQVLQQKY